MSLTIRMKRALAAFRADPTEAVVISGNRAIPRLAVIGVPSNTAKVDAHLKSVARDMVGEQSATWQVHSDYHRSRIIMGHRLDWYTTKTGKRESAQYKDRMYYNADVRTLFRGLGLKDRQ